MIDLDSNQKVVNVNVKSKKLTLFNSSNFLTARLWVLVEEYLNEKLDKLAKDKLSLLNKKFNQALEYKQELKIGANSVELSLDRLYTHFEPKFLKQLFIIDVNTKFDIFDNTPIQENIDIPDLAYDNDLTVLVTSEYLLKYTKLGLISRYESVIAKVDFEVIGIEIRTNEPIRIHLKVVLDSGKKSKPVINNLNVFINIENQTNGRPKVTFKIEGMDFIMNAIYKSANGNDKINGLIAKVIDSLVESTNTFIEKIISKNLFTPMFTLTMLNNAILIGFKLANK